MFRVFSGCLLGLLFAGLVVIVSSCGAMQNNRNSYTSSPTIDFREPNVRTPINLVDIQIKEEKVMGQSTGRLSVTNTIDELKKLALGNAILKANCDLIVAPFYIVELNGEDATVSAYGFPATYKIKKE